MPRASPDPARVLRVASTALDEVLERVGIEKALNPLNKRDFLVIQRRVTLALRNAAAGAEAAAMRRALQMLDVDWTALSSAAQRRVLDAASKSFVPSAARILPRVQETLRLEAPKVVGATRSAAIARFALRIPSSLSLRDRRVGEFVARSQSGFIRDELGRRRVAYSARARHVVSSALDRGLGRDEIAAELEEKMMGTAAARSRGYWNVVAGSFAGHARSYAQVSAYAEADIKKYRFVAVMDEVTSEICRFMDGRVFEVQKAAQRMEAVERLEDPEEIKNVSPWATVRQGEEGEQYLAVDKEGEEQRIATIEESAVGERDVQGEFSGEMDEDELEAAGVTVPPLHGNCRSTIVAEV